MTCSQLLHNLFLSCLWLVHFFFIGLVHELFKACSILVHGVLMTCSRLVCFEYQHTLFGVITRTTTKVWVSFTPLLVTFRDHFVSIDKPCNEEKLAWKHARAPAAFLELSLHRLYVVLYVTPQDKSIAAGFNNYIIKRIPTSADETFWLQNNFVK